MSNRFAISVFALVGLFFFSFFLWPIWEILKGGLIDADGRLTFEYIFEVFANPLYVEGLLHSFGLAVASTLTAMLIAVPLAFIADRYDFFGRKILMGLILMPIMLPPFVGAIGVRQILGQYGALNAFLGDIGLLANGQTIDWLGQGHFTGMVIIIAFSLYPIVYLNALAALANIDPAMEEAAVNLGCRGFKRFFKITFPLMRPGLFAGSTIVFIWSFTELGVPLIFDYSRLTSVQIFYGLRDIGGNPFPYALVTVTLLFSILIYGIGKGLFGRDTHAMMAKAIHQSVPRKPGFGGQLLCAGFFGLISLIAMAPHCGVIFVSFSRDWYQTVLPEGWTLMNYSLALGHELTLPSIQNSLIYASAATVINVILGIGIALVIVRTELKGRNLLDIVTMIPLAVPGLVIAFGYLAMSQEGRFFSFLDPMKNPTVLLIAAYAIRRLPFVVRSAVAGLQQTSEAYEEAAQNLGCPPFKTTIKITLPLITASILAGALLVFSKSMLEVSDSLILAQKAQYYPITKAIYELIQYLGDGRFIACALGVWAMAFLGITILGASVLLGKKLGAVFRV